MNIIIPVLTEPSNSLKGNLIAVKAIHFKEDSLLICLYFSLLKKVFHVYYDPYIHLQILSPGSEVIQSISRAAGPQKGTCLIRRGPRSKSFPVVKSYLPPQFSVP